MFLRAFVLVAVLAGQPTKGSVVLTVRPTAGDSETLLAGLCASPLQHGNVYELGGNIVTCTYIEQYTDPIQKQGWPVQGFQLKGSCARSRTTNTLSVLDAPVYGITRPYIQPWCDKRTQPVSDAYSSRCEISMTMLTDPMYVGKTCGVFWKDTSIEQCDLEGTSGAVEESVRCNRYGMVCIENSARNGVPSSATCAYRYGTFYLAHLSPMGPRSIPTHTELEDTCSGRRESSFVCYKGVSVECPSGNVWDVCWKHGRRCRNDTGVCEKSSDGVTEKCTRDADSGRKWCSPKTGTIYTCTPDLTQGVVPVETTQYSARECPAIHRGVSVGGMSRRDILLSFPVGVYINKDAPGAPSERCIELYSAGERYCGSVSYKHHVFSCIPGDTSTNYTTGAPQMPSVWKYEIDCAKLGMTCGRGACMPVSKEEFGHIRNNPPQRGPGTESMDISRSEEKRCNSAPGHPAAYIVKCDPRHSTMAYCVPGVFPRWAHIDPRERISLLSHTIRVHSDLVPGKLRPNVIWKDRTDRMNIRLDRVVVEFNAPFRACRQLSTIRVRVFHRSRQEDSCHGKIMHPYRNNSIASAAILVRTIHSGEFEIKKSPDRGGNGYTCDPEVTFTDDPVALVVQGPCVEEGRDVGVYTHVEGDACFENASRGSSVVFPVTTVPVRSAVTPYNMLNVPDTSVRNPTYQNKHKSAEGGHIRTSFVFMLSGILVLFMSLTACIGSTVVYERLHRRIAFELLREQQEMGSSLEDTNQKT